MGQGGKAGGSGGVNKGCLLGVRVGRVGTEGFETPPPPLEIPELTVVPVFPPPKVVDVLLAPDTNTPPRVFLAELS
jgi:hypothetical protein